MAEIRRCTLSVYTDTAAVDLYGPLSTDLVDGQLLATPASHAQLRKDATARISTMSRGPIVGIPVIEIPADGQWHDIGGGKLASVAAGDRIVVRESDTNSARKVAE